MDDSRISRIYVQGQSLIELLVAISIGAILIIAAVSVIVPALLVNRQVVPIQTGASLGAELLNNVRAWSEGDWHNILALATGTANPYYLNTTSSPFSLSGSSGGSSSSFNGYSYERSLTVNHTYVSGTQAFFPVLVSGTYSWLAATSSGGYAQNPSGYDVIFTSDSGCASELNWEVETYTSASGVVNYWVQVPSISDSSDATVYVCYGNSAITTDQSNKTGTWDANYKGIWHLPDGTSLTTQDSTSLGDNLSLLGGSSIAATGEIGGAASFNGSTYFGSTYTANFKFSLPVTFELWYKRNTATQAGVLLGITGAGGNAGIGIGVGNVGGYFANGSIVVMRPGVYNGGISVAPADTNWHHLAVTVNTTNGSLVYIDGSYVGTETNTSNINGATNCAAFTGAWAYYVNSYFNGLTDELRISNAIRTASWIKTEYNNQSNPDTFSTMGVQVGAGGGGGGGGSGIQSITIGTSTYSRYFYVNDVYRTGGNIVTSGGTYDPSTKFVTVVYQLPSGVTSSFAAYLTRHGQMIYDQTDWSGGSGASGPATTTDDNFVTSSGISYTTTTGSIYVAIPGY